MTDPATAALQRIRARLALYTAALEVAHSTPDCTSVEQTGMVAVPIWLIRLLQQAVADYQPEHREG